MVTIYLRTNTINGMQYVGQTTNYQKRNNHWNCLKMHYANELLTTDREKYGLDKWESKVLKECDDSEGDYWEEYYIKELNTKFPNGYNLRNGGNNSGWVMTEEQKNKISENLKGKYVGKKNWNYGIKRSEEAKKRISEAKKGKYTSILNHFYGKHHTEECRKKMSENRKGKPNLRLAKKVFQYTLDGELVKEWESASECSRNGFCQSSILKCCNGERNNHKGYRWSHQPL